MREVSKSFCKLRAKAVSFCGDLLELLRMITFLEVKLPKRGLLCYFITMKEAVLKLP